MRAVRAFLAVQVVVFAAAASIHFGLILHGYQHLRRVRPRRSSVLLAGLGPLTWMADWARRSAIAAQLFGVLGVLGLTTIPIGIGPQTFLDLAMHAVMLALLLGGLAVTVWISPTGRGPRPGQFGATWTLSPLPDRKVSIAAEYSSSR
jgi:hypothetical protein